MRRRWKIKLYLVEDLRDCEKHFRCRRNDANMRGRAQSAIGVAHTVRMSMRCRYRSGR